MRELKILKRGRRLGIDNWPGERRFGSRTAHVVSKDRKWEDMILIVFHQRVVTRVFVFIMRSAVVVFFSFPVVVNFAVETRLDAARWHDGNVSANYMLVQSRGQASFNTLLWSHYEFSTESNVSTNNGNLIAGCDVMACDVNTWQSKTNTRWVLCSLSSQPSHERYRFGNPIPREDRQPTQWLTTWANTTTHLSHLIY